MARFKTPFSPLIETFDAIGWVPTIRGNLSLNVFDGSNSILGDVDKYAVEVKAYDGCSAVRYLVASSLFTFDDSKKKLESTFRFIFRGTINDEKKQNTFITQKFTDEQQNQDAKKLFKDNGLLIGKLSIVKTLTNKLTVKEQQLLRLLKELKKLKKDYNTAHDIEAESFELLAARRVDLKTKWEQVESKIIEIETEGVGENPIYQFDVVLSRDGLLFLKDDTCPEFLRDYYVEGTHSDYKKNIPIHRVFKVAMNFIKFLFHMNYHHREDHDTSLPASNLHPIKSEEDLDKIVKHQIDALLYPITKTKRYPNKYTLCNPEGILLYAESFLLVLKRNELISDEKFEFNRKFIDNQKKEFESFSSDKKTIRNFFLSQKNILATFTIALSVLLTVIKTLDFFRFNDMLCKLNLHEAQVYKYRLYVVLGSLALATLLHRGIIIHYIFKGKFNRKRKMKNFLNRDSNINKGKFSFLYKARIWWIKNTTQIKTNVFAVVGLVIFILVVFFLMQFLDYS